MSNAAIVAIVVIALAVLAIIVFVTTQRRSDARRGAGALARVRRCAAIAARSPTCRCRRRDAPWNEAAAEARSTVATALATLEPRILLRTCRPMTRPSVSRAAQFFNRGMVTLMSVGLSGFGAGGASASCGPSSSRRRVRRQDPRRQDRRHPLSIHAPAAASSTCAPGRAWLTEYPPEGLESAKGLQGGRARRHGERPQRSVPEVPAPRLPSAQLRQRRSGSSARATVRSTTGSARRRAARASRHGSLRRTRGGEASSPIDTSLVVQRATHRHQHHRSGSGRPALHHGR